MNIKNFLKFLSVSLLLVGCKAYNSTPKVDNAVQPVEIKEHSDKHHHETEEAKHHEHAKDMHHKKEGVKKGHSKKATPKKGAEHHGKKEIENKAEHVNNTHKVENDHEKGELAHTTKKVKPAIHDGNPEKAVIDHAVKIQQDAAAAAGAATVKSGQ